MAATGAVLLLCGVAFGSASTGSSPKPSPGTRIVFHGYNSVRSVGADGTNPRTLRVFGQSTQNVEDVAASKNGKRLAAVTSKINSGPGGGLIKTIYVLRGDGSHPQVQVPGSTITGVNSVAMSSDGTRIAFAYRGSLVVSEVGSRGRRIIATGRAKHPAFSRDGSQVVYERNTSGNQDLYVVGTDGSSTPRRLTSSGGDEANPSFSPDGRYIAFASDANGGSLKTMRSNGTSIRTITTTGADEDSSPDFSPGGGSLVYVGKVGGAFRLFTIRTNGTHRKLVNPDLGAKDPQWTRR